MLYLLHILPKHNKDTGLPKINTLCLAAQAPIPASEQFKRPTQCGQPVPTTHLCQRSG